MDLRLGGYGRAIVNRKTAEDLGWHALSLRRGGGSETYIPRFTFHAFRYIELTGLPARPFLDAVEGLRMNSAVEPVGSFSCSNGLITEGGRPAVDSKGVEKISKRDGRITFRLASGQYLFKLVLE